MLFIQHAQQVEKTTRLCSTRMIPRAETECSCWREQRPRARAVGAGVVDGSTPGPCVHSARMRRHRSSDRFRPSASLGTAGLEKDGCLHAGNVLLGRQRAGLEGVPALAGGCCGVERTLPRLSG